MKVNIIPVAIFPSTGTQLEIRDTLAVNLNKNAIIFYSILDSNGKTLKEGKYNLTAEEYNAWGNNDEYVINTVATGLGLNIV